MFAYAEVTAVLCICVLVCRNFFNVNKKFLSLLIMKWVLFFIIYKADQYYSTKWSLHFGFFLMLEKHLDEMSSVAGFYVKIEILLILSASLLTRPYAV